MRNKFDKNHILSLCENGDYGIFNPPMKAQIAVYELCRYFLGEDHVPQGTSERIQMWCNSAIVYMIKSSVRGYTKIKRNKLHTPLTAQNAVNELCEYFLGKNWYDSSGETHPEQVNTQIVCEIEMMYKCAKIKDGE